MIHETREGPALSSAPPPPQMAPMNQQAITYMLIMYISESLLTGGTFQLFLQLMWALCSPPQVEMLLLIRPSF